MNKLNFAFALLIVATACLAKAQSESSCRMLFAGMNASASDTGSPVDAMVGGMLDQIYSLQNGRRTILLPVGETFAVMLRKDLSKATSSEREARLRTIRRTLRDPVFIESQKILAEGYEAIQNGNTPSLEFRELTNATNVELRWIDLIETNEPFDQTEIRKLATPNLDRRLNSVRRK